MKILYFSYTLPKPHAVSKGMFVYNRIKTLVDKNIELRVVTTSNLFKGLRNWGRNYNFLDIGLNLDQEVTNLAKIENPNNYMDLLREKNIAKLKKIFKTEKFDLLHTQFVRDGYYGYFLKKRHGIPYIVTAQGYDITYVPYRNKKMRRITIKILENANRAIFVSNSLLETAQSLGYSGKNSCVISNGFDSSVFKIITNNDVKVRDNSEKIIGFCGGLIKRKRADKLPEILNYVNNKIKNIKMVIIGAGCLKKEMETNFTKYGLSNKVFFTGSLCQTEVSKYMNNMDVFILPSTHEGFPTVISEAQACGLPVVCSDAEGCPEAAGSSGTVVSQGENFEKRFAGAIVKTLNGPISKENILKRSRSLDWDTLVNKEIKIYKEIIEAENG